jgi:hypothetical protein
MATDSDTDRFFNAWRIPKSDTAKRLVQTIITSVEAYEQTQGKRRRKRKPDVQKTFEATITAIVCDLIHYALTENKRHLVIPRSNWVLGRREQDKAPALNQQLPKRLCCMDRPEHALVRFMPKFRRCGRIPAAQAQACSLTH